MGLLDDAIKEHLALKRRHGASEDELRKQEVEALGPARREAPGAATDDGGPKAEEAGGAEPSAEVAAVDEAAPLEAEPDEVTREESLEAPVWRGERGARTQEPEPPAAAEPPTPEPLAPEPERLETEPEPAEPEPESSEPEPAPAERSSSEDEEPEGEDVLEETPDFLQETPEHDRLWFEQKPPRDFDFDE